MKNTLEQLLDQHLNEIWNQRDEVLRIKAIESTYTKDFTLFLKDEVVTGHDAINHKVTSLLNSFPPDFVISQLKPVDINNNIGKLDWGVGVKETPPVRTGIDILIFEGSKIKYFYVFFD